MTTLRLLYSGLDAEFGFPEYNANRLVYHIQTYFGEQRMFSEQANVQRRGLDFQIPKDIETHVNEGVRRFLESEYQISHTKLQVTKLLEGITA